MPAFVSSERIARQSAIIAKASPLDMTPEEHKRRGDAADAMFQEMKRKIAAGEGTR